MVIAMDRAWATVSFGLVLACGPSLADDTSTGSHGGTSSTGNRPTSSSTVAGTSGASVDTSSSTSTSTGTSGGESSTTAEPPPAACAAVGWDTSYTTFRALVEQAGGRYWYWVRYPVYGGGFSAECYYTTTLEVADGVVIRRILEAAELVPGGDPSVCTEPPFDETGAEVGAHESDVAGEPLLFDAYYESCCEDILTIQPAEDYDISFSTSDNGIVNACTAYEHGCADGCTVGPDGFGSAQFELGLGPLPR
jgi:hypothetical protein